MFDFDEHVLHALSPFVYPKPIEIDPEELRVKSKLEIININLNNSIHRRKIKLDVYILF
jgi:hypothetical protein